MKSDSEIWDSFRKAQQESEIRNVINLIGEACKDCTINEIIWACNEISEGLKSVVEVVDTTTNLPCPFCGKKMNIVPASDYSGNGFKAECETLSCVSLPPYNVFKSQEEARQFWNKRSG